MALAPCTKQTRQQKWTVNCRDTVNNVYMLKMLGRGLALDKIFKGCKNTKYIFYITIQTHFKSKKKKYFQICIKVTEYYKELTWNSPSFSL